MIKRLLQSVLTQSQSDRRAELYRNLIRSEAKIGGELFGPLKPGSRREFFCLDEHTWIWHEQWQDEQGQVQVQTTRYDVRPSGILKAQDGKSYQPLSNKEALNLAQAVRQYLKRVNKEIYSQA